MDDSQYEKGGQPASPLSSYSALNRPLDGECKSDMSRHIRDGYRATEGILVGNRVI